MALPTTIEAPRHRSADERLAEQLGGEHHRRRLMNAIANALEMGGVTRLEFESTPGSGLVFKAPLVLHGIRAW